MTTAVAAVRERSSATARIAALLLSERGAAAAVFALAAVLRLVHLGRTPVDPFYDAAVRSMGMSWHNLLVGALDPSARVALDKPPVDLWLQVGATKLLGFDTLALVLPAAVGGTLAVIALYDLLRTLAGPRAALLGALALAVLPISVISARSDTMDSVMAALVVAAAAVTARGLRTGRVRNVAIAGGLLGAAFEVKLFEAVLVALPIALMWWLGVRAPRRRRLAGLVVCAGACVAIGLAWLVAVTALVPAASRPWAFGSTNGSAWNAVFVYDGWDRLHLAEPAAANAAGAGRLPAPPGVLRLLSGRDHLGVRLGSELAAAWLSIALVLALRVWRRLDRAGRAGLASLAAWLALGTVLFSAQTGLRPRYLEAFAPAVAACLGLGAALVGARVRQLALAGLAAAVLALPLAASVAAVAGHVQDSGTPGALPRGRLAALSGYLRGHQGAARYELASMSTSPAAALVARDGRPVLILSARGHALLTTPQLARVVSRGAVRFAWIGRSPRLPALARLARWVRAHGVLVSRAAGQPRAAHLYRLARP